MTTTTQATGRVVVVTGAAKRGGLGLAIAERMAAGGARIVLSDLGAVQGARFPGRLVGVADELEQAAAGLRAGGADVLACACDVRDEAQVTALAAAAVAAYGRIDVWVNNAGVGYLMEQVTELSVDDWDTVLAVNLRGCFLGTKHAARQMVAQGGGGRIINIASQAAKSGFPFATAYTASKHGVLGLTRASAIELGPHAITVNAVCPNHVTTALGAWQNEFFSAKLGLSVDAYLAAMRGRIPLGRPGTPFDTAAACAFLASADAAYITGEALNVSGGEEVH